MAACRACNHQISVSFSLSFDQVVIVGSSELGLALYKEAVTHRRSLLGQVVIRFDPTDGGDGFLSKRRPSLAAMKPPKGDPTAAAAYLCRHRSCSPPVHSPEDLRQLLDSE